MADVIAITPEEFRETISAYADATKYPDEKVASYIERATFFIDARYSGDCPCRCRVYAIELMAAHLLKLSDLIASGDNSAGGRITSASIDKISVSLDAPQTKNAFEYWLSLTPYGQELLVLLMSKAPAGIYSGGKCYRVFR